MKINNLSSRGLEYLKQVKRHYRAGKWSQQELLLWHPMPHATSQVTQSSLCEHSQQTCPDVKETGLIYNYFSPCKALGECVRWLIWKSQRNLGSMSSQIMEACMGEKKNPQGSPFKVEKKAVWVQTAFVEDHQGDRAFQLSSTLSWWVQHQAGEQQLPPKPVQDHPSRQGWREEATSMKPGLCMPVLITVTSNSSPAGVKMQ